MTTIKFPIFYMFMGLPGSGKSSLATALYKKLRSRPDFPEYYNVDLYQSDMIRKQITGGKSQYTGEENGRVFGKIKHDIANSLNNGRSVILDATNVTDKDRKPFYKISDDNDANLILICMFLYQGTNLERLRARQENPDVNGSDAGEEVFWRMHARFTGDICTRPQLRLHGAVPIKQNVDSILLAAGYPLVIKS